MFGIESKKLKRSYNKQDPIFFISHFKEVCLNINRIIKMETVNIL